MNNQMQQSKDFSSLPQGAAILDQLVSSEQTIYCGFGSGTVKCMNICGTCHNSAKDEKWTTAGGQAKK